jgi:hypothetical protein
MTYDLSRAPTQIFEDHADPGATITYTNTTSCPVQITGVVMSLNGAPADQATFWINDAVIWTLVIATGDAAANAQITAEISLQPDDTLKFVNGSAIGTLGFCVSGWAYNPNG